jgi:hypothetical protein
LRQVEQNGTEWNINKTRRAGATRAVAWFPDHATRSGLCKVLPTKRPNWRAHYPNPQLNLNPNPKQDNLCEEVARISQSPPGHRLAAKTFNCAPQKLGFARGLRLGSAVALRAEAQAIRPPPASLLVANGAPDV